MNIHKNARITVYGRYLLCQRISQQSWPVRDAANAAGVSVRTAYKWLARWLIGGLAALNDRSLAPHCCHRIG